MQHLGFSHHYVESGRRHILKIFIGTLKTDNKDLSFVFILGCCSDTEPAAGVHLGTVESTGNKLPVTDKPTKRFQV